ncbi:Uncharacterised protein (plasmid) [Mesomycoplasma conjunctivae]|nr:Uncharacterised protein [Mesomycoplasma conjunctivae]
MKKFRYYTDRESLLKAVTNDGMRIEYCLPEFKNDKEIVLKAVKNNGRAYYYSSQELQKDDDVIKASFIQSGDTKIFDNFSDKCKNNKKMILKLIERNPYIFRYLPDSLKKI